MKNLRLSLMTLVLTVFLPVYLQASPILDQAQLSETGGVAFWSDLHQAQTFTSGITGSLDRIDLQLSASPSSFNEQVHVSLVTWDGSNPGGSLGNVSFYMDDFSGSVDFSSQNIQLSEGGIYAFILTNDLSYYSLPSPYRNTGTHTLWNVDGYTQGSLWTGYNDGSNWQERSGTDMLFSTYMTASVPEPASISLLLSGALGIALMRRKKRSQ